MPQAATDGVHRPNRASSWLHVGIAAGCVLAAGGSGALVTLPNIPGWYEGLAKPWFTPPNGVFGPAWTALYALMAYAFFRILRSPGSAARTRAIYAFAVQILFNGLWSFAFFGARSPLLGLAVIVPLWVMIAATIWRFARIDRFSAWLLAPYLAWVTYAAALNAGVWLLN